jgi:hypothetical protein
VRAIRFVPDASDAYRLAYRATDLELVVIACRFPRGTGSDRALNR